MTRTSALQRQFTGEEYTFPGTLRLYRAWYFSSAAKYGLAPLKGYFLGAWSNPSLWAECWAFTPCQVLTPNPKCTCGIYGYYLPPTTHDLLATLLIHGTVKASGKILLGTTGARVAHAEIESLYLSPYLLTIRGRNDPMFADVDAMRGVLGRFYPGVPVYTDKDVWLTDFPPENLDNLLPPDPPRTAWQRLKDKLIANQRY